jgi:hypothetical protein
MDRQEYCKEQTLGVLATLSIPKMLSGANSFEMNEIQEVETEVAITERS